MSGECEKCHEHCLDCICVLHAFECECNECQAKWINFKNTLFILTSDNCSYGYK
jgi:hypothetical protein